MQQSDIIYEGCLISKVPYVFILTTILLVHSRSVHLLVHFFDIDDAISKFIVVLRCMQQKYPRWKWLEEGRNEYTVELTVYAYVRKTLIRSINIMWNLWCN